MVQWLGLCTLIAEGPDSNPGWGAKILQAVWCNKKKTKQANKKQKGEYTRHINKSRATLPEKLLIP